MFFTRSRGAWILAKIRRGLDGMDVFRLGTLCLGMRNLAALLIVFDSRNYSRDLTSSGLVIVNVQAPGFGKQSNAPRRMTLVGELSGKTS